MSGPEAVKVIVRCRPMNKREKDLKSQVKQSQFTKWKPRTKIILKQMTHYQINYKY